MVKLFLILVTSIYLFANPYETNCLYCHKDKKELKYFMAKYSLQYSSEKKIKKALFRFLKNPTSNKSVTPYGYIIEHGFKEKSRLNDKDLKDAINTYYDRYNLKQFIK